MTFKKQFPKSLFLDTLSSEWQKTSEIRDKVGCSQKLAKETLNSIYEDGLVEWKPAKGGREGTREWKIKGERKHD